MWLGHEEKLHMYCKPKPIFLSGKIFLDKKSSSSRHLKIGLLQSVLKKVAYWTKSLESNLKFLLFSSLARQMKWTPLALFYCTVQKHHLRLFLL